LRNFSQYEECIQSNKPTAQDINAPISEYNAHNVDEKESVAASEADKDRLSLSPFHV